MIWAVGAVWVGGVRLGTSSGRARRVGFVSTVTALGVAASFIVGGYLAARVPFLDDQIDELISRTDHAFVLSLFLVAAVTGVAEEMFFRGALFDVASRSLSGDSIRTVAATTILYTVVTAVTANLGLTLAAAALGAMVGTARAYSGSVIPAIVGHLAWTVATIGILPQLI
ncbi:CPBP family intramembrane glutamic endopeptidase [Gordonia sp. MP11Mi]|uniref:CPBP family intramembrane glutamic endopeptidase n=1 Tax=Gordonia sp. MP11Mi TaxID=3022769 RepID=UPI003B21A5C9